MAMSQERRLASLFRQAAPGDVVSLFEGANPVLIRRIAKRLGCEFSEVPTYDEIRRLIQGCLTLRKETYLEELLVLLQEKVGETAEKTLGEAFEKPSREDLARLTPVLIEKHGKWQPASITAPSYTVSLTRHRYSKSFSRQAGYSK
jgi:hypothetical protein